MYDKEVLLLLAESNAHFHTVGFINGADMKKNLVEAAKMLKEDQELLTEGVFSKLLSNQVGKMVAKDSKNLELIIKARKAKGKSTTELEQKLTSLSNLNKKLQNKEVGASFNSALLLLASYINSLMAICATILGALGLAGIATYLKVFGTQDLVKRAKDASGAGLTRTDVKRSVKAVTEPTSTPSDSNVATLAKVVAVAVLLSVLVAVLTRMAMRFYAGKLAKEQMKSMAEKAVKSTAGKLKSASKNVGGKKAA